MENVLTLIKRDHDRAAEAFAEVKRCLNELVLSEVDVRAAFHVLKHALISHLNAEEEAVYSRLKSRDPTRERAYEGAVEHGLILDLLEKMSNDATIDRAWKAQFAVLEEEVEQHVEEEELGLFPRMKKIFPAEELAEMGEDLRALKTLVDETSFALPYGLKTDRGGNEARPGSRSDTR